MNQKMQKVAAEIESTIIRTFPVEYQLFVFDGRITIKDIVSQIMVELCKYSYDSIQEKHSLTYYLGGTGSVEDDKRMALQRTVGYINERRSIDHNYLKRRGWHVDGLITPKMEDIKSKTSGHKYSAFQFWEINNVRDMRLVKAIVEKRIAKKYCTIDIFKEYAAEYDDFFSKLEDDWKRYGENSLFAFLALFTLEWKYSFDFYYEIATEMLRCNVKEIPGMPWRLTAFSATGAFTSILSESHPQIVGSNFYADSRVLIQRRKYIHDIVTAPEDEFIKELCRYNEILVIVVSILTRMTVGYKNIQEWFVNNTTPEDWESVFRDYDVFQAFTSQKDWSNRKKIRYVKNIYDKLSFDYKNPENRS